MSPLLFIFQTLFCAQSLKSRKVQLESRQLEFCTNFYRKDLQYKLYIQLGPMLCPESHSPHTISCCQVSHYNRPKIPQQSLRNSNKEIPIFIAPQDKSSYGLNTAYSSWPRTSNPLSVLFNVKQLVSVNSLKEILIAQLGAVDALSVEYKSRDLIAKVLFVDPAIRIKAIEIGITIQNTPIVGLPVFTSESSLIKIDINGIPNCHPETDLKNALIEAISPFGEVVYLCVYRDQYHIFCGKASAYLDISALSNPPPLRRFIDLGNPFDTFIEIHADQMPLFCRYCKGEGHVVADCHRLHRKLAREQPKDQDIEPITPTPTPTSYPLPREMEKILTENIAAIKDSKTNIDFANKDITRIRKPCDIKPTYPESTEPIPEHHTDTMPTKHSDNDIRSLEAQIAVLIKANKDVFQAPFEQEPLPLKPIHPSGCKYAESFHGSQDYVDFSRFDTDDSDSCTKCPMEYSHETADIDTYYQRHHCSLSA
ncbi:hypothetical protein CLU79DRAFT_737212 [Phycomyces nitens]|nr:hypothetical protein CLU79DRAFT_737212 [Phycomyces nitens]